MKLPHHVNAIPRFVKTKRKWKMHSNSSSFCSESKRRTSMTRYRSGTIEAHYMTKNRIRVNRWNTRKKFNYRIGSSEVAWCTRLTLERKRKDLRQKRWHKRPTKRKMLLTLRAYSRIIRQSLTSQNASPPIEHSQHVKAPSRRLSNWRVTCSWSRTRSFHRAEKRKMLQMSQNPKNHSIVYLNQKGQKIKPRITWCLLSIVIVWRLVVWIRLGLIRRDRET